MDRRIFNQLFLNLIIILFTYSGLYIYIQVINKSSEGKDEGFGNSTVTKSNKFVCQANDYKCVKKLMIDLNRSENNALLLGNSQLGAINQFSAGEINYAHHLSLNINQKRDTELTVRSIWMPNATLGEFNKIYSSIMNCSTRIDNLVLPLFLDDTREQKIRKSIENYSSNICKNEKNKFSINNAKKTNKKTLSNSDKLDEWIINRTIILKDISDLNSNLRIFLYKARNSILKINASSKRKIIPAAYQLNVESLEKILNARESLGMLTIIYIPPILNFASGKEIPYFKNEYLNFKNEMKDICNQKYCRYFDLDSIIPDSKWGLKNSTNFGGEKKEIDFMHFTFDGHKILSNRLNIILNNIGK